MNNSSSFKLLIIEQKVKIYCIYTSKDTKKLALKAKPKQQLQWVAATKHIAATKPLKTY